MKRSVGSWKRKRLEKPLKYSWPRVRVDHMIVAPISVRKTRARSICGWCSLVPKNGK